MVVSRRIAAIEPAGSPAAGPAGVPETQTYISSFEDWLRFVALHDTRRRHICLAYRRIARTNGMLRQAGAPHARMSHADEYLLLPHHDRRTKRSDNSRGLSGYWRHLYVFAG